MVFRLFEVRNLFGIPPEFLRAVVVAAEEFIYSFGHLLGIAVVLLLRQGHAADRRDRSRRKIQMRRKLIQKTDRMIVAILQSSGKNRQNQMVQMQVMGQEVIPGNILQMLI